MTGWTIVLEAGGMRNTFASGVLYELTNLGFDTQMIDHVYACSSGASAAAFFITGQNDITRNIWVNELTKPELCSMKHPFQGKTITDPHLLTEITVKQLDLNVLKNSHVKLEINIARAHDGDPKYVIASKDNFFTLLKATCSIPLLSKPVEFEGEEYLDGGMSDSFPVLKAYSEGHKKLLLISNRPKDFEIPWWEKKMYWLVFPRQKEARDRLFMMSELYEKTSKFIHKPPKDVQLYLISPEEHLPCHRLSRDEVKVDEAFDMGIETARSHWSKLKSILKN